MKAIIAGGGIGGLTSALCFAHFGWNVTVLEQATAITEIGAGIQISPNAMKVFEALGIDAPLIAAGFKPEAIELRMGVSGNHLIRAPLGDKAVQRWGSPYIHIHRADLIAALQASLKSRAPDAIKLGASVTGYRQTADAASVHLADGSDISGDIVIGADGIHSAIRTQMLGPDKPTFTGNVAWRAVVPVERLGADVPNPVAGAWMGRGKHAVTYLLRQGKLANLVAIVERDDWTKEGWNEQGEAKDALEDFANWHPAITRLIKEADTLYRWALFDRPPLAKWTDQRVALTGDAAHPMLPFMAQGAAMAIEDAWAMAACASKASSLREGLARYHAIRFARASTVQAGSRANAKTFHQRTLAGQLKTYGPMWLAGRVAPIIAMKRQDATYGYDITAHV